MIDRVKNNLATGLTRAKWIATFLAERTRAGTSVAKLLYESSKLGERIDELYRDIGRRVMELKEKDEDKEGGRYITIPKGWVKKIEYLEKAYGEI